MSARGTRAIQFSESLVRVVHSIISNFSLPSHQTHQLSHMEVTFPTFIDFFTLHSPILTFVLNQSDRLPHIPVTRGPAGTAMHVNGVSFRIRRHMEQQQPEHCEQRLRVVGRAHAVFTVSN